MSSRRRIRRAKQSSLRAGGLIGCVVGALLVASVAAAACVTCVPRAQVPSGPVRRHAPPGLEPARTLATAPGQTASQPARTASPAPAAIASSMHVVLGVPTDGDPSDDHVMDKGAYVVSYNPLRKVPNWVSWKLDRSFLGRVPRRDRFMQDGALPRGMPRVTASDYAHSGYDRGHLCPSADRTSSPDDNAATFLMTNMQPQLHELNDGPWKDLEEHERALARSGKVVFIVAGGVFGPGPRTIGRAAIAVPEASYKLMAVLEPGQGAADVNATTPVLAAIMPNEPGVARRPWRDYTVSIDQVEHATAYDFLSNVAVSVQQVLESRAAQP